MAIFKCKICGGTLEINAGETVATCEYCGTKQTLPKLDDEKKANLFDRANHFRRNNDFDKAMGIYEQILNEDTEDAESYWSIVLCRYGIEYVEDPSSRKRVPTVNRAQFTSIFDDEDYKSAIKYADINQKAVYEAEASAINEIQKGILAISQKEDPFDVFICYKETDNNGRRTQDSVLATELYHELKKEGFKVFFSRITLEDKLGVAYEPYIFAALHSAKVMVAIGTKPEHFNAVWVKNEWSRYLSLIKNGANKILIPAYRDMDPYDLPEEFSHLQAQDMSKLGFMQDLVRGIKKIVSTDTSSGVKETVVVQSTVSGNTNTEPLLKRAFMFLEDGDWKSANEYCEKVLDLEPENAEAYLGKLLAELHISSREKLADCAETFDDKNSYQKAIRFGDKSLCEELKGYVNYIVNRNEETAKRNQYNSAVELMEKATTEEEFLEAAEEFEKLWGYCHAEKLATECRAKATTAYKNKIYDEASEIMTENQVYSYEDAIELYEKIRDWRDSETRIELCKRRIEEIKAEQVRRKKDDIKFAISAGSICVIIFVVIILYAHLIEPAVNYKKAIELMEGQKYEEAQAEFEKLGNYKDAEELFKEAKYNIATELKNQKDYDEAIEIFEELEDYKDTEDILKEAKYNKAILLKEEKKYNEAIEIFQELGNYKDSNKQKLLPVLNKSKLEEISKNLGKTYSEMRQKCGNLIDASSTEGDGALYSHSGIGYEVFYSDWTEVLKDTDGPFCCAYSADGKYIHYYPADYARVEDIMGIEIRDLISNMPDSMTKEEIEAVFQCSFGEPGWGEGYHISTSIDNYRIWIGCDENGVVSKNSDVNMRKV